MRLNMQLKKQQSMKTAAPLSPSLPPAPLTPAVAPRLLIFHHANRQAPPTGPFVPIKLKLEAHSDKTCELSSW